jgi:hypothetical protein
MAISHEEVLARLSPEMRARVEARTQELIEEEMTPARSALGPAPHPGARSRDPGRRAGQRLANGTPRRHAAFDHEQLR